MEGSSPLDFVFDFISGEISFSSFCTILVVCFLCWLAAELLLKVRVWSSDKSALLLILTLPLLLVEWTLYVLGLPFTVAMHFYRDKEFRKNSKIARMACTIGEEYEAYSRFVKANEAYDSFYAEVRSKYNAFRYYYCLGNDGDGTYKNSYKTYDDYRDRSHEEKAIMYSLNSILGDLEHK